jgi:YfiH family protein
LKGLAVECIRPDWPSPARVRALVTTRGLGARPGQGSGGAVGGSDAPFDRFNLASHVGDDEAKVAANREQLRAILPQEPRWLNQVHGVAVFEADDSPPAAQPNGAVPEADAAVTRSPGRVLAIMTADCLPVLMCDRKGEVVAVAHAGWRGLAAGVVERALQAMRVPAADVIAWLGPAIGPEAFEVGQDVVDAFVREDAESGACFRARGPGKYLADLYGLARRRLVRAGVDSISGGEFCTYRDADRFYSYRRDGRTGRMASLVWIEGSAH